MHIEEVNKINNKKKMFLIPKKNRIDLVPINLLGNIDLESYEIKLNKQLVWEALNNSEILKKIDEVVNSGKAAEKFEKMVSALGGPKRILTSYQSDLPQASYIGKIIASIIM